MEVPDLRRGDPDAGSARKPWQACQGFSECTRGLRDGDQDPSLDRTTLATAVASSEALSWPGAVTSNVRPPPPNTTVVYSPTGRPIAMHASSPTPLNGSLSGVS